MSFVKTRHRRYIDSKQNILTSEGIGKGLAEAGIDDIKGVAEFLSDPIKGLKGLKQIISNPEARKHLGNGIINELNAKIDHMSLALQEGGDQHAEQLGKDIGSLVWQVGSAATAVGGAAKGGVALSKVGIKLGKSVSKLGEWVSDISKVGSKQAALNTFKSAGVIVEKTVNVFKNRELFETAFKSPEGLNIGVLAETEVSGNTLFLKDIVIYAKGSNVAKVVGPKEFIKLKNQIAVLAKQQGFEKLVIQGKRVASSTSANKGHIVNTVVDLTKLGVKK